MATHQQVYVVLVARKATKGSRGRSKSMITHGTESLGRDLNPPMTITSEVAYPPKHDNTNSVANWPLNDCPGALARGAADNVGQHGFAHQPPDRAYL